MEPSGDQIPPCPGRLRCAAQPDCPVVLVLAEAEDVTVKEQGEQVGAEESAEGAESDGVEEG